MQIIHQRIGVTSQTIKELAVKRRGVTFNTVIPLAAVTAGKYREELRVMIGESPTHSSRVTEITIVGIIVVSLHPTMGGISQGLSVGVTIDTLKL